MTITGLNISSRLSYSPEIQKMQIIKLDLMNINYIQTILFLFPLLNVLTYRSDSWKQEVLLRVLRSMLMSDEKESSMYTTKYSSVSSAAP